jgi:hypothetical protein
MPVERYQLVEATAAFSPLPYGLLSVVELIDDGDPHWQHGIEWQEDVCDVPFVVTGAPCGQSITKAPVVTGIGGRAAQPFAVVAWVPCAPIGQGENIQRIRDRTERVLTNGESRAVENVFWSGTAAGTGATPSPGSTAGSGTVYPHLAANAVVEGQAQGAFGLELQSAATVVTSGAPVDIVEGVAALEAALGSCYGGQGVIHVPAAAVAHLVAWNQVERQGTTLRTKLGHKVAVYASGNRQGPDGTNPAGGQGWIYATGAVFGRRSPIRQRGRTAGEVIGRADNTTVYVVERTYVIGWDCCHLAALVSLGGVDSGGIGVAQ